MFQASHWLKLNPNKIGGHVHKYYPLGISGYSPASIPKSESEEFSNKNYENYTIRKVKIFYEKSLRLKTQEFPDTKQFWGWTKIYVFINLWLLTG